MQAANNKTKPYVTYLFLSLNLIIFILTFLRFGTTQSSQALLTMGANFRPYVILNQEWWRLVSATFIHIGLQHLLFNMLTLYFMGPELESILGHLKFGFLYMGAGIGGNLTSFAFSNAISAGASTALFGMFASFVVLAIIHPKSHYLWQRSRTFLILIILNLVNGLFTAGIDNWGHIGGLVFGGLLTYIIGSKAPSSVPWYRRLLGLIFIGFFTYCLLKYGSDSFYNIYGR